VERTIQDRKQGIKRRFNLLFFLFGKCHVSHIINRNFMFIILKKRKEDETC